MTRHLFSLATFSLLMSACGGAASLAPESAASRSDRPVASTTKPTQTRSAKPRAARVNQRLNQRLVGDYFVHRFSGTYRQEPVTLTEEVVEWDGDLLVIDYVLEQAAQKTRLRVRLDPEQDRVVRVARVVDGKEVAAELADYAAMMQQTVFAPDYNEGRIAREQAKCMVAGTAEDCVTNRYHVFVGEQAGTLIITTSRALPGRDVSGTLKSAHGDVLYRSELVEMRRGKPESAALRQTTAGLRFVPDGL